MDAYFSSKLAKSIESLAEHGLAAAFQVLERALEDLG